MPEVVTGNGRGSSELWVALVVRRAAIGLKIAAGVLGVAVLVQGYLAATIDMNEIYGDGLASPELPFKVKLQNFLQTSLTNLIWVALLAAAAYGLQAASVLLGRRAEPADDATVDEPDDLFTASPSAVLSAPPAPVPRWARSAAQSHESAVSDDIWKP